MVEFLQRLDHEVVDGEPDRAAPVRVAAEHPRVGFRGQISHGQRLVVANERVRMILVIFGKGANAVVGKKLGFVEHAFE